MITALSIARACLRRRSLLTVAAVVSLPACAPQRSPDMPAPMQLFSEVREMLAVAEPSPEYYRARSQLDSMGPEVDAVLVASITSRAIDDVGRLYIPLEGGSARLFMNGRTVEGSWRIDSNSRDGIMFLDSEGELIGFGNMRVWAIFAPDYATVTVD